MPTETTICRNISRLIHELNDELKTAHELGLRAHLNTSGFCVHVPQQVWIEVWHGTTLLSIRPPSLMPALDAKDMPLTTVGEQ